MAVGYPQHGGPLAVLFSVYWGFICPAPFLRVQPEAPFLTVFCAKLLLLFHFMGLYVAWKVVWSTALPVGFCTQCPGLGIHSSGSLWDSRPTVKHKPQRPLCARPAMSSGLPVCWAPPTQLLSCPVMGLCKHRLLWHDCFKCSVDAVISPYLCICIYFVTFWLGLGYLWFNITSSPKS